MRGGTGPNEISTTVQPIFEVKRCCISPNVTHVSKDVILEIRNGGSEGDTFLGIYGLQHNACLEASLEERIYCLLTF